MYERLVTRSHVFTVHSPSHPRMRSLVTHSYISLVEPLYFGRGRKEVTACSCKSAAQWLEWCRGSPTSLPNTSISTPWSSSAYRRLIRKPGCLTTTCGILVMTRPDSSIIFFFEFHPSDVSHILHRFIGPIEPSTIPRPDIKSD